MKCKKLVHHGDKKEWLAKRKQYVTATDVPGILGVTVWDNLASVAGNKLFGKPFVSNRHIKRGNEAEPHILEAWTKKQGMKYRPSQGFLVSTRYGWLGATPDAFARDKGETILIEIKCPERAWREIPENYLWQLKAQLVVTGLRRGFLVAASYDMDSGKVGRFQYTEVVLSKEDEDRIVNETKRFYKVIKDLRPVVEAVWGRYFPELAA